MLNEQQLIEKINTITVNPGESLKVRRRRKNYKDGRAETHIFIDVEDNMSYSTSRIKKELSQLLGDQVYLTSGGAGTYHFRVLTPEQMPSRNTQ